MNEKEAAVLLGHSTALARTAAELSEVGCPLARARAEEFERSAGLLRGAVALQLELRDVISALEFRQVSIDADLGTVGPEQRAARRAASGEVVSFLRETARESLGSSGPC